MQPTLSIKSTTEGTRMKIGTEGRTNSKVALVTGASSGIGKATAARPKLHYPVGRSVALSRMRRFVPAGMFDKSFRKQFQLD